MVIRALGCRSVLPMEVPWSLSAGCLLFGARRSADREAGKMGNRVAVTRLDIILIVRGWWGLGLRGHLATSGDIFGLYNWWNATGI